MPIKDIIDFIIKYDENPTFIKNEYFIYYDPNEIINFINDLFEEAHRNKMLLLPILFEDKNDYIKIHSYYNTNKYTIELTKINNDYRWSVYNYFI